MKVSAKCAARVEIGGQPQQLFGRDGVDLVEHQDFRRAQLRQPGEDGLDLLVDALVRVDQQGHRVGVAGPAPGRGDHGAVEPALWRENAGRIDEDDLRRAFQRNAAHQRARRLHLARDDRHLGADKLVEQRRFAGVGRADQRARSRKRSRRLPWSISSVIPPPPTTPSRVQKILRAGLFGEAFGAALGQGRLKSIDADLDR